VNVANTAFPRLYFYFLSYEGPSETPIYPHVYATIAAGPDFELRVPNLARAAAYVLDDYVVPEAGREGGRLMVEESMVLALPNLAQVRALEPFVSEAGDGYGPALDGEAFDDVRHLAKRPCFAFHVDSNNAVFPADWVPLTHFDAFNGMGYTQTGWTFDTWFRACYAGYSGGTCWKLLPIGYDLTLFKMARTYVLPQSFLDFDGSSGLAVLNPDTRDFMELRAPDRCDELFKAAREVILHEDSAVGVNTYCVCASGDNGFWSYQAAGDDRLYIMYLAPPRLFLRRPFPA